MLSPLTITLIQSTILNALANFLAQLIDQYKHDHDNNVCRHTEYIQKKDTYTYTYDDAGGVYFES